MGNISSVDLLQEQVQVRLDSAPEAPKRYKKSEIRVLRNGKGSRDGIEIPKERPARAAAPEPEEAPFRRRDPITVSSVVVQSEEESRRPAARRPSGRVKQPAPKQAPAKLPGKPRQENRPKAEKRQDRPEKLPVRTVTDTTAEKKAAADRAARQEAGEPAKSGAGRRRPYRRPRGK